ncbi:MAG: hypothetical protein HZC43_09320 [Nitrosomonadales bacterium]|nr:hypothetical protein [Nitrosomonadales bacterium]
MAACGLVQRRDAAQAVRVKAYRVAATAFQVGSSVFLNCACLDYQTVILFYSLTPCGNVLCEPTIWTTGQMRFLTIPFSFFCPIWRGQINKIAALIEREQNGTNLAEPWIAANQ